MAVVLCAAHHDGKDGAKHDSAGQKMKSSGWGKELYAKNYYQGGKGWNYWDYILRYDGPKASAARQTAAKYMEQACSNKHIGYDQSNRWSLWSAIKKRKKNGKWYDPASVTEWVETDCSALVATIYKTVGYVLGISQLTNIDRHCGSEDSFFTGNMVAELKKRGFTVIALYSKGIRSESAVKKKLKVGDILVETRHHTEMVTRV